MALDMLLAEKGGVCKMFGDACCMMTLCRFCCIPCIRGLIQRAIVRALNKPDIMYMRILRADDYDGSNDDVNPKDNNTDSYV